MQRCLVCGLCVLLIGQFSNAVAQEVSVPVVVDEGQKKESPAFLQKILNAPESLKQGDSKEEAQAQPLAWQGSLLFSDEDLKNIRVAIKSYKTKVPLEILLPELFPSQVVDSDRPVEEEVPQEEASVEVPDIIEEIIKPDIISSFYLTSILYFAPDRWSIWLNGRKVTSPTGFADAEIIDVQKNAVYLLWKDVPLSSIATEWRSAFLPVNASVYASKEKNVIVDVEKQQISFILKPNQTFVTNLMSVVEGRVTNQPVVTSDVVENVGVDEFGGEVLQDPLPTTVDIPELSDDEQKLLDDLLRNSQQLNTLRGIVGSNNN